MIQEEDMRIINSNSHKGGMLKLNNLCIICTCTFGPCQLGCLGSSVGKSICLDCRVLWVQIPPDATHFHFFICRRCLSFFLSFHLKCHHLYFNDCIFSSSIILLVKLGLTIVTTFSYTSFLKPLV